MDITKLWEFFKRTVPAKEPEVYKYSFPNLFFQQLAYDVGVQPGKLREWWEILAQEPYTQDYRYMRYLAEEARDKVNDEQVPATKETLHQTK